MSLPKSSVYTSTVILRCLLPGHATDAHGLSRDRRNARSSWKSETCLPSVAGLLPPSPPPTRSKKCLDSSAGALRPETRTFQMSSGRPLLSIVDLVYSL